MDRGSENAATIVALCPACTEAVFEATRLTKLLTSFSLRRAATKGGVLAAKAAERQGKGAVLAANAQLKHKAKAVSSRRSAERYCSKDTALSAVRFPTVSSRSVFAVANGDDSGLRSVVQPA